MALDKANVEIAAAKFYANRQSFSGYLIAGSCSRFQVLFRRVLLALSLTPSSRSNIKKRLHFILADLSLEQRNCFYVYG